MSGGPYTLNGSVSVITDQSQGGAYTLSPVSLDQNTINPSSPVGPQNNTISSQSNISFGGSEQSVIFVQAPTSSTLPIFTEQNTYGAYTVYPNTSYQQDSTIFEIDTVTFGKNTYASSSLSSDDFVEHNNYALLFTIIFGGILFVSLILFKNYHKNS
jgi:hypothetical protein